MSSPSLLAALGAAAALLPATARAGLYPGLSTENHTCSIQTPVLSCSAGAADPSAVDTCCVETFGGLILATQFWDTYTGREAEGQLLPKDSWTRKCYLRNSFIRVFFHVRDARERS